MIRSLQIFSCKPLREIAWHAAYEVTGIASRIVLEIVLMLRFGRGEFRKRFKRRDDGIGPAFAFVHEINKCLRFFFLFIIRVENGGTIGSADIIPLAVQCGGIVDLKKEIQQIFEIRFGWIVGDFQRLGVSRMILIGGILILAAGVSSLRVNHARKFAEQVFHSPEASAGKDGCFRC